MYYQKFQEIEKRICRVIEHYGNYPVITDEGNESLYYITIEEKTLDCVIYIYEKYHVMTETIYRRIHQVVAEIYDYERRGDDLDEDTENDLIEWILEAVDDELDSNITLEDVGMCLADFG